MSLIYDRMMVALNALTGNQGEGWFVIMEEPETEKFVQFAFDEGDGLVFDCPTMSFTEDELAKAAKVMERFGIKYQSPGGADDFASINADLGMNNDLAAQVAAAVFSEVFMFPDDIGFNIIINS